MTTHVSNDQHHQHEDPTSKVVFGFWIYVMTDAILFATLFASYAVLHNNTYGSAGIQQITNLPHILIQSLVLLLSTLTYGFTLVGVHKHSKCRMMLWLLLTFLLGAAFIGMQLQDFCTILHQGYSWQTSAFFSIFFTLVGTFTLHMTVALVWILIVMIQLLMQGITPTMKIRFTCLGLFWNFLSIIWGFIFTLVYLMGAI